LEERKRLIQEVSVALRDASREIKKLAGSLEDFVVDGGEVDTRLKSWAQLFDQLQEESRTSDSKILSP